MPHQSAVTVVCEVEPQHVAELDRRLAALRDGSGPLPFAALPGVHFARLFLLPADTDLNGADLSPRLVYAAEVDGPVGRHLARLADLAGTELDPLFELCRGYPAAAGARQRADYLRRHLIGVHAWYVNTVGRGLDETRREARLRDEVTTYLDGPGPDGWRGIAPRDVHERVRQQVAGRDDLSWALRRPRRPAWWWRAKETVHLVAVPLAGLLLAPLLVLVLPIWAVALRASEQRDVPESRLPDPEHLRRIADLEDRAAQNPFSAVGLIKPGRLRRWTASVAVLLLDYATRHVYTRGSLAGVRTIHFARWVFLDDKRRVLFLSNYDGSLESYMDDFIDKLAWGLNAVFSNGVGYPRTRWLVRGGATDEQTFKNFLRRRQLVTQVWYSAYPSLTARNLDNNSRIREGLTHSLDDAQVRSWLTRL